MKKNWLYIVEGVIVVILLMFVGIDSWFEYAEMSTGYRIGMTVLRAFSAAIAVSSFIVMSVFSNLITEWHKSENRKNDWKKIVVFDAVLVIVGVALFVMKGAQNYIETIDHDAGRYLGWANLYAMLSWGCLGVETVFLSASAMTEKFKPRYEYEKEELVLTVNGEENKVLADIFKRINRKGEIKDVEVRIDFEYERLSGKGKDKEQALKNLENELRKIKKKLPEGSKCIGRLSMDLYLPKR